MCEALLRGVNGGDPPAAAAPLDPCLWAGAYTRSHFSST